MSRFLVPETEFSTNDTLGRADELRNRHFEALMNEFDTILDMTESPIERLFLTALLVRPRGTDVADEATPGGPFDVYAGLSDDPRLSSILDWRGDALVPRDDVTVWLLQPEIALGGQRIRCDFAVIPRLEVRGAHNVRFIIECDGHADHDRTKAQAAADKLRDRQLTLRGFRVLRFTGSQINRNPVACLHEATLAAWLHIQQADRHLDIAAIRRSFVSEREARENGLLQSSNANLRPSVERWVGPMLTALASREGVATTRGELKELIGYDGHGSAFVNALSVTKERGFVKYDTWTDDVRITPAWKERFAEEDPPRPPPPLPRHLRSVK